MIHVGHPPLSTADPSVNAIIGIGLALIGLVIFIDWRRQKRRAQRRRREK
ncbi:hypothetical protein ACWKWP_16460 [Agromyces soli]